VVRTNLPYKTIQELIASKYLLMVGAMGQASNSAQIPRMLQEYCGLNVKLIMYTASAESMLAIERNEVDSRAGSYDSFKPFIERGIVRPLVRGYVATKETENLPVNEDLTTDKKGKAVMRMLSITDLMGRPFVCPPGTPAGTMNILQDAFAKVSADPEAKAEARKVGMELQFVAAKEIEKTINFAFNQPPDIMAEFLKLVQ
jgi:tripartite-type tricarboxylate transporter receptor subunit TctC